MLSSKPRSPKNRRASGRSVTTIVMWSKPSVRAVTMRPPPMCSPIPWRCCSRSAASRARLRNRPRVAWSSSTLRSRTAFGVTSTHSSSLMNSRACSSEKFMAGVSRSKSSAVAERMLFSFFSLVGLTSISSARAFSPTIMPS